RRANDRGTMAGWASGRRKELVRLAQKGIRLMWERLKALFLGPKCGRPLCDRRAAGLSFRTRRRGGRTFVVLSDPEPLCHQHLKEFRENYHRLGHGDTWDGRIGGRRAVEDRRR